MDLNNEKRQVGGIVNYLTANGHELTRMEIEGLKLVFPCVVGLVFIDVHSRFDGYV